MAEPNSRDAIARSPIAVAPPDVTTAGWAVSSRTSTAPLTLLDCTPLAKVSVRADPARDPAPVDVPFGRAVRESWPGLSGPSVLLVGSGPGEWLVLGPPGSERELVDRVQSYDGPTGDTAVVDLTHGRALIRLTGDHAADVLAYETAFDLDDDFCPNGAALRCLLAGLAVDVVRDDRAARRSYLLGCDRSAGQYLFDALVESGDPFGIDVDGFVPPGI